MHRNHVFLLCAVLALALAMPAGAEDDTTDPQVTLAVEVAVTWLESIDAGEYAASWEEAAVLFREAVSQERWQRARDSSRKPLGDLVSREVKTTTFTTTLPGAPDGEYVVIQFTTSFANKESAVETVTPMKDPDGEWRVSGYYIK